MNDADVSKQIQQMVRFIRQEAEEKANEISVSAEEVCLSIFSLFPLISTRFRFWMPDFTGYMSWLFICIGCWLAGLYMSLSTLTIARNPMAIFFILLQEFNIEKLQLVEAEKKKIRQEYEKKEKQVEIRKKMYLSGFFLPDSLITVSFSVLFAGWIFFSLFLPFVIIWKGCNCGMTSSCIWCFVPASTPCSSMLHGSKFCKLRMM